MSNLEWEKQPGIITPAQSKLINEGRNAYNTNYSTRNPYMDENGNIIDKEKYQWWQRGNQEAQTEYLNKPLK